MTKSKIMILMAFLMILMPFAASVVDDDLKTGLKQYYVFANNSVNNIDGNKIIDWSDNRNATIATAITCPSTEQYCELTTDSSSFNWSTGAGAIVDGGTGTYLISMYNSDSMSRDKYAYLTSSGDSVYYHLSGASDYAYYLDCGDATYPRSLINAFPPNTSYNLVVLKTGANAYFFKNNTNVSNITTSTNSCSFIKWGQTSITHDVKLYVMGFWNRSLSSDELAFLEARLQANRSYNPYTYSNETPPEPAISFNANTTAAGNYFNQTQNYIYGSVYITNFNNSINSTIYIYNSSGLYASISSAIINFSHNFTGLPIGVYYLNASSTNSTRQINTTTRTIYIYSLIVNSTYPETNTSRYLNITYAGNTSPSGLAVLSNFSIILLNSDLTTNKTLVSSNGLNLSKYIDFYNEKVNNGTYYIKIILYDTAGNNGFDIGEKIILTYEDYLSVGNINFTIFDGFVNNFSTNLSYSCINGIDNSVNITAIFNGATYTTGNHSNNTAYKNISTLTDGENILNITCYDWRIRKNSVLTSSVYAKNICLIDERTNAATDLSDLNFTSVKVYYDDNSTLFDFLAENITCANFTSMDNAKLRFEAQYSDATIIIRYVDVSLLDDGLRVCINNGALNYYEQDMISASQTPAILKSVFSNCLIAADYTRFAYQNAYLLKASTIDGLYYLYTYSGGSQVYLASVDGSISTYINLDNIEFNAQSFDVDLLGDTIGFYNNGTSNTTAIYYKSQKGDNANISVIIIRMDTGDTLLSTSDFTDANEFNLLLDYSTLTGVNASTIFKMSVYRTLTDGTSKTTIRYFTPTGKSGLINTTLAVIISVLLLIFGLTFASTKITFSWFGLIIIIGAIAVLSLAIMAWYVLFLMALEVILLIYFSLLMVFQGKNSLVGGVS